MVSDTGSLLNGEGGGGAQDKGVWQKVLFLKRVIGKGCVPEKVIFELRPLSNECASCAHILGKSVQTQGRASAGPQGGEELGVSGCLQWSDGIAQ